MGDYSQFKIITDFNGDPLKGEKYYEFHLPCGLPVCKFWSVILYDSQTDLLVQTDQSWPSVHSNRKGLVVNTDGAIDIWTGPEIKAGKEGNFIKTTPGISWYAIVRLYDLKKPADLNGWKPGEIREMAKDSN